MDVVTARLDPLAPDDRMRTSLQRGEQPLTIFRTLAHHPSLMRRVMALGSRFLFEGNLLDARAREIMILRSAYRSGSIYEFGQHTVIGQRAGLSTEEIARLARPDPEGWPDRERILITVVDELAATDTLSDATWADLRAGHDEATVVEILLLPGFYRMLAGFLNAAGVEREPDTPGWPS